MRKTSIHVARIMGLLASALLVACGNSSSSKVVVSTPAPLPAPIETLQGQCTDKPWMLVSASPDARANSLLACMTADEKASLLGGDDAVGVLGQSATDPHTGTSLGVTRLGIPTVYFTDGPVGVRQGSATAMPAPVALAASFDAALAREYGAVLGNEAKFKGNDAILGPCVDIVRNPLAGRTFETYGEDPLLSRRIGVGWINGVQGEGVIANAKHFAGNNQEPNRNVLDAVIDARTLHEIYLPAYEGAVKDAKVGTVMCAYNSINGAFMCENKPLLSDVLRGEWGFTGYVLSDYPATHSTAPSLNAGLEFELPSTAFYSVQNINAAVASGSLKQTTVDQAVLRILRTHFAFGVFDRPRYKNDDAQIDKTGHAAVAQKVAERGMVLLKNSTSLLPLNALTTRSIALIGRDATIHKTAGSPSSGRVTAFSAVTPQQGFATRAPNITLTVDDGNIVARAASVAAAAEVAIVFVSSDEREFADRPCMSLMCSQPAYGDQDALVRAVAAANPRTVVVVISGSPVLMPWLTAVPAVIQGWYMGQQGGAALARLVFGDVNFSGKLPMTFWAADADTPTAGNIARYPGTPGSTVAGASFTATHSEGIFVGYRWADANNKTPQFPFGFGLSYTSFAYENLRVRASGATVTVRNTGQRAGRETAQLYMALPAPSAAVAQAPWALKGFESVELLPGESRDISFALDDRAFSYWDASSKGWKIAPGCYRLRAGDSSRDLRLAPTSLALGGGSCP